MQGIALLQAAHRLSRWKVMASFFINEDEDDDDDGLTLQDPLTLTERTRLCRSLQCSWAQEAWGREGFPFYTTLLSRVRFKDWKADCVCPVEQLGLPLLPALLGSNPTP